MKVMVHHKVRDYDMWKPVFDADEENRRRHKATGHEVYRDLNDPNNVFVLTDFPSKADAEAFAADPSLKEAMERGGVTGEPHVFWIEKTETVEY